METVCWIVLVGPGPIQRGSKKDKEQKGHENKAKKQLGVETFRAEVQGQGPKPKNAHQLLQLDKPGETDSPLSVYKEHSLSTHFKTVFLRFIYFMNEYNVALFRHIR